MTDRLRRARENESGFTLIELMVVVLVLGILMAIAIPTFLGARNKAQNKAPQASLRIELENAKLAYIDGATYGVANNAANTICTTLNTAEPSVNCLLSRSAGGANNDLAAGASTKNVSLYVASTTQIVMAARSASNTCYYLRVLEAPTTGTGALAAGVYYGQAAATATNCSGYDGRTVTGTEWTG